MVSWRRAFMTTVIGLSVLATCGWPLLANSQDSNGRKMVHVFSLDFPPDLVADYPSPPMQETRFWQLLDREVQATGGLALTENVEQADYRVELRCAGYFRCSQLAVDIKDTKRNVVASFALKNIAPALGLWKPDLEKVSRELAIRLDERIKLLDQGGYGYSD